MNKQKKKFIKFSIKNKALKFGNFYLKSERKSPYFFNISQFYKGKNISKLGKFYAQKIINQKIKFDVLFGIAYKGIPIVISTVIALKKYFNLNIPYCFNRKETKTYGEKGNVIGSKILNKKIIILDDVLTSGKAIKEAISIIKKEKTSRIVKIIVSLNRQEHKKKKYLKNVSSIIKIKHIIKFCKKKKNIKKKNLQKIIQYHKNLLH
ncbi:orotate phosphoribosyltransferase [Buchnera aphidicola]|uniref:orotate phosphoribosyltransferase n=1 Tax=Buchnera aphidicola TaxID=9 RepID=UPI0030EBCD61